MIQILSPQTANQIAAGEVILRPASVVKELLENAVDSGATDITVTIMDSGKTLIEVSDNGCGMSCEDAQRAFIRHATSKISSIDDLQTIRSFGFRGEALPSIAAIAQVTLNTTCKETGIATEICISGGEISSKEEVSPTVGTKISVRNLFFNVPVRRKFLKSDASEFKQICVEFQRVAIIRHSIAMTLVHNSKIVHKLPATNSLKQRLCQIIGTDINQELVEINLNTSFVKISGFIGNPESARKTTQYQFMFVNGRFFKSAFFNRAIMNGYQNLLPEGKYPSYFITFETEPSATDINIHPTKTEIKFQEEQSIFQVLQSVVKEGIGKNGFLPSIDFDTQGMPDFPTTKRGISYSKPPTSFDKLFNPFNTETQQRPAIEHSYANAQSHFNEVSDSFLFENKEPDSNNGKLLIVGNKYIITPIKSGLMVIHIRRALEKVICQELNVKGETIVPQHILYPVELHLLPQDIEMLERYQIAFKEIGFLYQIEHDNCSVKVDALPPTHPADAMSIEDSLHFTIERLEESPEDEIGRNRNILLAVIAENRMKGLGKWSCADAQMLLDKLLTQECPNISMNGELCITTMKITDIDSFF